VEIQEENMNPTVKTILIWVIVLFVAVGLWNIVERRPSIRNLSLTDFLTTVQRGEVRAVTISGSSLMGRLNSGARFETTIPTDYPALYDKLAGANVRITIAAAQGWDWSNAATTALPLIVAFAMGWMCARFAGWIAQRNSAQGA
jgi:ATP-dependent Zn protease